MFILTRFLSLLMFINVSVGKDLDKTPPKRLINGQNEELFDFPSLASLSKRRIGAWFHYCSAVLVSPTKLVTAAHCVRNKKIINVRVSLGMVNLFGPPNEFEQVLRVDKFDMHDGSYITNDIAVITMATPAKLNKNVKVVVLAEKDSNYVRENCTISGWGRELM
ncbi:fibrinolytic enzyme, isozyme C-like [Biomphalaria glabrata]|uniref:Fibrinolytic enzyme, isozyme C-like n=1 Tax=Biomphalaria glabrata TaxID=6526 RepID=A0A9W3AC71_BIOGL|nr:fibrinolytic enzyme, isozyme C-like [Biomphalaria glabrata]